MALPEYVRPQKHNSWFNVSPLRDLTRASAQRVPFLDSFVTVSPVAESPRFAVLYEGRLPLRVSEHFGFLCAWFGDDLENPAWSFPELFPNPYAGEFVISRPRIFHDTNILDLIENNGDLIHFRTVHRWLTVKLCDYTYDERAFRLKMSGKIQYGKSADSALKRRLAAAMPVWQYSQELAFHGPGFGAGQVSADMGIEAQIVLAFTPVGERDLKLHIAANVNEATLPRPLRWMDKIARRALIHRAFSWVVGKAGLDDTDGDYRIWRHKRSLSDPKLLSSEADILRIREWMAQYYLRDFVQPAPVDARAPAWQLLALERDIVPERVNTFRVSGEELIAYNTSDGSLRVFEAHCPHQGAHLGHGGRLQDDCVGCPFHEFYFDRDGAFVGTSPGGKVRPHMKLKIIPHRRAGQRIEVLV